MNIINVNIVKSLRNQTIKANQLKLLGQRETLLENRGAFHGSRRITKLYLEEAETVTQPSDLCHPWTCLKE